MDCIPQKEQPVKLILHGRDDNHVWISNEFIDDHRISLEAAGFVCELLAHLDWESRREKIMNSHEFSAEKRYLQEVASLGYVLADGGR